MPWIQDLASIAVILALLALILAIVPALWQYRLLRRYKALLAGSSARGETLEALLLSHAEQIESLQRGLQELGAQLQAQAAASLAHVQHVGIVRFRAFPETGSDLSFSIALLDGRRDGVVITSLYGRHESRIYAKPIQAGQSTYPLTEEEKQAIQQALAR